MSFMKRICFDERAQSESPCSEEMHTARDKADQIIAATIQNKEKKDQTGLLFNPLDEPDDPDCRIY